MKRRLCLVALGIIFGWAGLSMATDLTITITTATKKAATSGKIAVRETVDVTITNIGSSAAADLVLAIIDGTNLVAVASSFTNLNGAAVGELNLNTVELTNVFAHAKVGRASREFDIVVWDTDSSALLANDTIEILNNPYVSGMTLPSSLTNWAEADARYVQLSGQYVKTVEVSGGLLSVSGTYTQTVALTTNTFTNTVLATDGAGSGYDADLLDGQEGSYYVSAADVSALEARTSAWNQAATDASSWTNWFATNLWYSQILALEGQTDGWNSAWTWVQANSNAFDYVEAHTGEWDIAYQWVNTNSNAWDYVQARTSAWDQAATDSASWTNWWATNGISGLTVETTLVSNDTSLATGGAIDKRLVGYAQPLDADLTALAAGGSNLVNGAVLSTQHYHSGLAASDGSPNPAVSVNADGDALIYAETTGDNFGIESVTYPVTSQTNSTWMGYSALSTSPGSRNSAMGYYALSASAGSYNTAAGYQALSISAGSYNSAMGYSTLRASAGSYNSAMGYYALYASPGNNNSAMGYYALNTSPGSDNTAAGYQSGYASAGSHNSAMGYYALSISPGDNNSAMGYYALRTSPGSRNTAAGYQAGYKTGGQKNVFMGAAAAVSAVATLYTNAIAIGADSVTLGNSSTTTTRLFGNVGIGTNTPSAKAHIVQTAAANSFRVDDAAGDTTPFVIDQSGNVGVGTDTPATTLDVVGSLTLHEVTAQPANPVEGACVIWQSNGTGYGDDGDLCIITQAGGVLYTNTIVDVVP